MRLALVAAFLAIGLGAPSAAAQTTPPATPAADEFAVDANSLAAARRLLAASQALMFMREEWGDYIDMLVDSVPPEESHALRATLQATLERELPDLLERSANAYARRYAVDDLNAFADFFESELGQRYLAGGIPLAAEFRDISREWTESVLYPKFMAHLEERRGDGLKP